MPFLELLNQPNRSVDSMPMDAKECAVREWDRLYKESHTQYDISSDSSLDPTINLTTKNVCLNRWLFYYIIINNLLQFERFM